jgi:ABC-type Mn2+/Zn2+ transport system ATPase subunit
MGRTQQITKGATAPQQEKRMKTIIGDRGSGKTTKLVKAAAETFGYIICSGHNECCRIADLAKKLNLDIPFPLTYHEFLKGAYYNHGIKGGFYIDNADELLRMIATVPIKLITVNNPYCYQCGFTLPDNNICEKCGEKRQ